MNGAKLILIIGVAIVLLRLRSQQPTEPPSPGQPPPRPTPGPDIPAVAAAKADMARALGVDATTIRTLSVVARIWPDASLGYAGGPGRMYAQVQTPGYEIVLGFQHGAAEHPTQEQWLYHTDESGRQVVRVSPQFGVQPL